MEATRVMEADMVEYTPVGAVAAGTVVVQGLMIGIATADIPAGVQGALATSGVFEFVKITGNSGLTVGAIAYWDDSAKVATSTVGANVYLGKVVIGTTTEVLVKVAIGGMANASGNLGWGNVPAAAVTASGTASGDSPVAVGFTLVSGADATKAVTLPIAGAGKICVIKNADAAILKVFPATGDKINGGTATTGYLAVAASTIAKFVAYDATDWYSLCLVPS